LAFFGYFVVIFVALFGFYSLISLKIKSNG